MDAKAPEVELRPGDVLFHTPEAVARGEDSPLDGGQADALLVLEVAGGDSEVQGPEGAYDIVAVRLGQMSGEAVANHLPQLAERLTKPKVFFIGGEREPVVVAIGLLDADGLGVAPQKAETLRKPVRFGSRGQFIHLHTGDDAPPIDEQVADAIGLDHVDPSALLGLRLFHSYVTLSRSDVAAWVDEGRVDVMAAEPADVFAQRPGETWRQLMKRLPFPANLFVTWAEHQERN